MMQSMDSRRRGSFARVLTPPESEGEDAFERDDHAKGRYGSGCGFGEEDRFEEPDELWRGAEQRNLSIQIEGSTEHERRTA